MCSDAAVVVVEVREIIIIHTDVHNQSMRLSGYGDSITKITTGSHTPPEGNTEVGEVGGVKEGTALTTIVGVKLKQLNGSVYMGRGQ